MGRPAARNVKGFRDLFSGDLLLKQRMIDTVRTVYERYGFVPLETPAVEFVDVLGKFLPEQQTPEGGIFAFRNPDASPAAPPDDPDLWLSLRYDLTAPLARVVAQYSQLQRPFRRYQIGSVWRYEKPGPGRYREFIQFDFDSVGVPSVAADAEACMVMCDVLEALGFARGEYAVKVNDRKIMQGILEACRLGETNINDEKSKAAAVLRAIDKLDRVGLPGVRELLGAGRKDASGDVTAGAGLAPAQIALIEAYLVARGATRAETCTRLTALVGETPAGKAGIEELSEIDRLLTSQGYADDRVSFDPSVIRGLSYYTGPVFEGLITREVLDEQGRPTQFGTVFGGGRYDGLVERFTGQQVPATGASIGVDRLLAAMSLLKADERRAATAQVLVTVMDRARMPEYLGAARRLREAGINTEVFMGEGRIGNQLKYADKLDIPLAIVAGGLEFERSVFQVKDLRLGRALSGSIAAHDEWKKSQPAQREVAAKDLVSEVRRMLAGPAGA
jgi:histidyl-tRNA synthetase